MPFEASLGFVVVHRSAPTMLVECPIAVHFRHLCVVHAPCIPRSALVKWAPLVTPLLAFLPQWPPCHYPCHPRPTSTFGILQENRPHILSKVPLSILLDSPGVPRWPAVQALHAMFHHGHELQVAEVLREQGSADAPFRGRSQYCLLFALRNHPNLAERQAPVSMCSDTHLGQAHRLLRPRFRVWRWTAETTDFVEVGDSFLLKAF